VNFRKSRQFLLAFHRRITRSPGQHLRIPRPTCGTRTSSASCGTRTSSRTRGSCHTGRPRASRGSDQLGFIRDITRLCVRIGRTRLTQSRSGVQKEITPRDQHKFTDLSSRRTRRQISIGRNRCEDLESFSDGTLNTCRSRFTQTSGTRMSCGTRGTSPSRRSNLARGTRPTRRTPSTGLEKANIVQRARPGQIHKSHTNPKLIRGRYIGRRRRGRELKNPRSLE
jgi:hypothetical protein